MLLITLETLDISLQAPETGITAAFSLRKPGRKFPGSGGRSSCAALTPWQATFRSRGNGNLIKPLRIVLWTTAPVSRLGRSRTIVLAKGKPVRNPPEKMWRIRSLRNGSLKNSSILKRNIRERGRPVPHVYCGRDARAPRLNHFGTRP